MVPWVVLTGTGVVAPGESDRKAFWGFAPSGRSAVWGITLFDAGGFSPCVAAEADVDPVDHRLSPREVRRMDGAAQMAVVAAQEAVGSCGWWMPGSRGRGWGGDRECGGVFDEFGDASTRS
ncbi:beta-ketoacyl synthase N-terminal-like domain-containing protein [Streptantibioticus silvisoli]|uniref:beta-ketoacyl synthase N-terminal-like domain-containing protein n=1 Tax=Streptantibioticus silvisoli TaxID=2705255 RepID=UPI0034DF079E